MIAMYGHFARTSRRRLVRDRRPPVAVRSRRRACRRDRWGRLVERRSSAPQRYATGHGEQRTWRLPDSSVMHLNTDTAVTVRYGRSERLVELEQGQAFFEVAHEPARRFRVVAGMNGYRCRGDQIRRLSGPRFDGGDGSRGSGDRLVRQIAVIGKCGGRRRAGSCHRRNAARPRHAGGRQRSVAWLRRQIAFDQEPLAAVVAEFNRYGRCRSKSRLRRWRRSRSAGSSHR